MIMHKSESMRRRAVALPLPLADRGRVWRVSAVVGGESSRRRLAELGFVADTPVEVLQSNDRDMVVVRLGESRLAMASGMANQVRVC